ncbi:GMP synthase (glutamine-hydrolyzing), partial [Pseudomonas aeruginosa]|nr:GMP synthase (glutamine-hydrolyzing) [Pseudomonas aeruginosa]
SSKVRPGLSGGVDTSEDAALLHKASGDQLTSVIDDNGLLRLHEGDQEMAMFAANMGVKVIRANAAHKFLRRLAGLADPEEMRKI